MAKVHLSPAEYVIHVFGSVTKTAKAIGRAPSSVSEWRPTSTRGRRDGMIPRQAQQDILMVAKRKKLKITEKNLITGGYVRQ